MILILVLIIISIALLAFLDNDKSDKVWKNYCRSECTVMQNKKQKFY